MRYSQRGVAPQREFGTGPENHFRMKIDLLFFTALNAVFRFCNQLSGVRSAISDKEWPEEVSEEVDIDNHVDSLRTGQRLTYLK